MAPQSGRVRHLLMVHERLCFSATLGVIALVLGGCGSECKFSWSSEGKQTSCEFRGISSDCCSAAQTCWTAGIDDDKFAKCQIMNNKCKDDHGKIERHPCIEDMLSVNLTAHVIKKSEQDDKMKDASLKDDTDVIV